MWNRFVNHKGYLESNHPMDLDVEHDNIAFKTDIHSFEETSQTGQSHGLAKASRFQMQF